jgi:HK97 family phage major capsid protein
MEIDNETLKRLADLSKETNREIIEFKSGVERRIGELETVLSRPPGHSEKTDIAIAAKKNPKHKIDYKILSSEDKAYFDSYLRKGMKFLEPDEMKLLVLSDNPEAGYLAPVGYSTEVIRGIVEYSPIRENARVVQISELSMKFPKKTGASTAGWTAEVHERLESDLTFALEEIPSEEMFALVKLSLQQLEDSALNLANEAGEDFAEQFGKLEGTSFVLGDGVGKPEGILTHTGIGSVLSGVADAILPDSLISLTYGIKRGYRKNAKFYMNDQTIAAIRLMKDKNDRYLFIDPIAGEPARLLGYEVVSCPDMPDIEADAFPVVFGDMIRAYLIVDRIRMSIQRLGERWAEFGIVGFLGRRRVGGQVVLPEALVKLEIGAEA